MKNRLQEYSIPVVWNVWGRVKVQAYSEDEAKHIVLDSETPLPTDSHYIDDSLEIDENGEKEGRVGSCRLGIVADGEKLKPDTKMYRYPFSNVSGFHLCTGNNTFPKCAGLHTIASLPYYILSMPNNNHNFDPSNNKLGLEMRDLLEHMKDKTPEFYYTDILLPNGAVLNDFIKENA